MNCLYAFFLNNIFLCQKIFTSILFCNNCQRQSWKAIFFFLWFVHAMHRESRCVGKPPVLKPCVAFKRVKHNASWVQRCMLRAWQAEEIQTREFSLSAVSLLNIADCWHKPSDMSNSWIILFVSTWYTVTVNILNFSYIKHFAVSVENMLNCRFFPRSFLWQGHIFDWCGLSQACKFSLKKQYSCVVVEASASLVLCWL